MVKTERSNECKGGTDFSVEEDEYGVGDYVVTASIAAWSAPDTPTEGTTTLNFITAGT